MKINNFEQRIKNLERSNVVYCEFHSGFAIEKPYGCPKCNEEDGIKIIRVSDWTDSPGSRYKKDGPYSGQEFCESVLIPAFKQASRADHLLLIDLDGLYGYSSGFLAEAFGGLSRRYDEGDVRRTISIKSDSEPGLIDEIEQYITTRGYGFVNNYTKPKPKKITNTDRNEIALLWIADFLLIVGVALLLRAVVPLIISNFGVFSIFILVIGAIIATLIAMARWANKKMDYRRSRFASPDTSKFSKNLPDI